MNKNVISTNQAANLIHQSNGTVFTVGFYKKGKKNGEGKNDFREMRARIGSSVRKGLAGGPAKYNPQEHGLIWAYLMAGDENRNEARNRRSIPVSGIVELNIGGHKYRVAGQPHE